MSNGSGDVKHISESRQASLLQHSLSAQSTKPSVIYIVKNRLSIIALHVDDDNTNSQVMQQTLTVIVVNIIGAIGLERM